MMDDRPTAVRMLARANKKSAGLARPVRRNISGRDGFFSLQRRAQIVSSASL